MHKAFDIVASSLVLEKVFSVGGKLLVKIRVNAGISFGKGLYTGNPKYINSKIG